MSRQFDEYMSDKFELNGELHQLVDPTNLDELVEAINTKDLIQQLIDQQPSYEADWPSPIMQEQEDLITEYVESLGEFDNSLLVKNLNYLLKKYGLRMGELEKLLGISAGYISRTTKEGSNKRLSIDVLWKIARLFEVDLRVLLMTDMEIPNNNVEMIIRFMSKLRRQTETYDIEWTALGGVETYLDESLKATGLFKEEDDDTVYIPFEHMNPNVKFILEGDIVGLKDFKPGMYLVIIPFKAESLSSNQISYDFIMVAQDGKWERVFYTSDTPFYDLDGHAGMLYDAVKSQEFDVKLESSVKSLISDYLK